MSELLTNENIAMIALAIVGVIIAILLIRMIFSIGFVFFAVLVGVAVWLIMSNYDSFKAHVDDWGFGKQLEQVEDGFDNMRKKTGELFNGVRGRR